MKESRAKLENRNYRSVFFLALLAVQFGAQPYLFKAFTPRDVAKSSLVLCTDVFKVVWAVAILLAEGRLQTALAGWNVRSFIFSAGLPSMSFLLQGYCIQIAYANLDSVVFNVLNQTKLLFTALFVYLMTGRSQSRMQVFALCMLTLAGVFISMEDSQGTSDRGVSERQIGLIAVCVASALSGLGAGMTEYIMRNYERDNYLLTSEMAVLGVFVNLLGYMLMLSPDSGRNLFIGWTPGTLVPILTQSLAGVLVGLVTKLSGAVMKSFSIISGLVLTCSLKALLGGQPLPLLAKAGVPLAILGMYLHATNPLSAAQSVRHGKDQEIELEVGTDAKNLHARTHPRRSATGTAMGKQQLPV
mmetsp:Transcript_66330/g.122483  ORF Transcript_66330/g.122483 Transcript_66330/m.122483 type:complete len:358 (-) Transcript_66330:125-1198(-)